MYSIAHLIVGVPITKELSQEFDPECDLDADVIYDGTGLPYTPGWIGICFGRFDPCSEWMALQDGELVFAGRERGENVEVCIPLSPTDEQVAEAKALYDALPDEAKWLVPDFGVYIVWGTS